MWRVFLCTLVAAAAAREFTEEDQFRQPRLFHLDSYERCLVPRDGLYCVGTFRLSADKPNAAYNFIKEYSSDPQNFDRTLVHRGYCLSSRCPSKESNTTLRFERCIEQHALSSGLRASLESSSCKKHEDLRVKELGMDIPQRILLGVVAVLLFMNLVGTLYDLVMSGEGKSKLLTSWSIRSNWARLLATHEDGDPRLTALGPVQGIRVLLLTLVMMTHAAELQHKIHLYNPEYYERILQHPITMLIRNGSALTQIFIVISNFLFAYSLLLYSKSRQLGLAQLPLCILHRLARITPVHLLVVGFAATWWRHLGDGPQWAMIVGAESETCRKKFWTHALFLHNAFYADEYCLLPTWFLAVDLQLYIAAAVLTLYLMQKKKRQIPILAALFLLSCVMNFGLAYINEWKSLLYIMVPENVRLTFRGIPSFSQFYTAPWGSLPAALLGLLSAHVHFDMQEQGYKITKHKWFVWLFHMTVPLHMAWILAGNAVLAHTTRVATAAYVAIERPSFAILASMTLLGIANNVDDWFRRALSWRGWAIIGRMSLSIMMLHWVVNVHLLGIHRTLTVASVPSIAGDMLSTMFVTTVLALPLTLLVESPIQRSFTALLT
ncbi:O-acyltransferase like protein-like [Pararge aegeria]|uniref:O-acyltransferase like protein-like n=1 Tax=Pararge aegeria TaxID=116150 RepID=UPI0019D0CA70|nr:O-acyltransferase like protein-like [Pararge aegeria]